MSFKKYFFFILVAGFLIPLFSFAGDLPTVILFYGEGCFYCEVERMFLRELKQEMPGLEIIEYEVWRNEENKKLFLETAQKFNIETLAVPLTIVRDQYLVGFDNPENYGEKIKQMLKNSSIPKEEISHSLPFLTVVLGVLDGFNPCSMWSLLVLLTLVIATGSRKKVWLAGSVFIITSYISYFLFMSAWLNTFIFLDYIKAVRIIVGLVAIVAGCLALKEFYTFKPNVCEVSSSRQQKKFFEKIKKVLESPTIPMLVLGVAAIAFSVNLIELLCSLGLPVIFTKTLTMYHLATWKYYTYIGLYDFFYMLDDIVVLLIAGFSMKFLQLNGKYSRWSRLIAGILMLVLGIIFILKPELLMFGVFGD
jgi:thiol-disulfide isomerase/thioredoxin